MFGKNKEPKVKQLSPRETLMNRLVEEVEQLAPGQSLVYKLPEFFWTGFAAFLITEVNPSYPEKGKKYVMSTDRVADGGKPAGQGSKAWQTNNPREIADWIAQRHGQYGEVARFHEA